EARAPGEMGPGEEGACPEGTRTRPGRPRMDEGRPPGCRDPLPRMDVGERARCPPANRSRVEGCRQAGDEVPADLAAEAGSEDPRPAEAGPSGQSFRGVLEALSGQDQRAPARSRGELRPP